MAYTVKQLSELSGVTVRALHFYEEEQLLKPAYYGTNGYRYYAEKELLQLQQILFFKELGFTLRQIKKVLGKSTFDQLTALHSHKKALTQEHARIGKLLNTIDATIKHVKGKKKMDDQAIFDGFNIGLVKKAKEGTSYALAEKLVLQSVKKPIKNIEDLKQRGGRSHYQDIVDSVYPIFRQLAAYLESGLEPKSPQVQDVIEKHHALTNLVHDATPQVYQALAQLYREHPEFRKQLDPFHPKLAEFLSEGMTLFAQGHSG